MRKAFPFSPEAGKHHCLDAEFQKILGKQQNYFKGRHDKAIEKQKVQGHPNAVNFATKGSCKGLHTSKFQQIVCVSFYGTHSVQPLDDGLLKIQIKKR